MVRRYIKVFRNSKGVTKKYNSPVQRRFYIFLCFSEYMVSSKNQKNVFSEYCIATLGSHTALQILKGAHDEGFKTLTICKKNATKPYTMFNVADEIIEVRDFSELFKVQEQLNKKNAIIIPHGSFVEYLRADYPQKLTCRYFGNKEIIEWEADRTMERQWLLKAKLKLPKIFKSPKDIKSSVIVKFHGALGGKGYFLAKNEQDFNEKIKTYPDEGYVIQEYIIGVPVYIHYFYSPLTGKLELMGFDKRYESNVDSIGRISARDQIALEKVDPSYVIVGNIPIVLRESLLTQVIEMGERVVAESKALTPNKKGLFGPFCLETILTPELEFYVFEISARIVAGTNPYIMGSPYSQLLYDEPMSTGRRIAREIKHAIQQNRLPEVLG